MSVIFTREQSYFFSSDVKVGAQQVSADGSSFAISLNNPISIPRGTVNCKIGIHDAQIWYVNPNISILLTNNTFTFTTSVAPAGTYTITFADGLYSLDALKATLSNQIVNLGLPPNLFILSGDDSTQRIIVTILTNGDSLNFTTINSVRTLLGFASGIYTAPSAMYNLYGTMSAKFNSDSSYLITSDIVPEGIPVNNQSNGVLINVPIKNVVPGSQIVYEPTNIVWSNGNTLIGNSKQFLRFKLTNQNLVPVNTVNELWQFTMIIKYQLLLSNTDLPLRP